MKLTPLDIRHKEFKRGMRGYADVEVDEFLDEVADEYERLFKENIDLNDRLEALEEKVAGYKRIEETLQKTLVNAQASAEEQKQNASKEGQLILQDAELKSRQMVNEAYTERQAIEQSMAKLRNAEQDFRFKFRQMLEGYLQQFPQEPEMGDPEAEGDFARHAEAIKEAIARESSTKRSDSGSSIGKREAPAAREAKIPETPAVAAAGAEPAERVEGFDVPQFAAPRSHEVPPRSPAAPEVTMSRPPTPESEPDSEAAGEPAGAEDEEPAPPKERILFGESDDLLADVDTGVNENEFKW